jgi:adenine deaminase
VRFEDARDLNAYLAAGIESDHGFMSAEQIVARARLGMIVEVCCAAHRDNVAEAVKVWEERGGLNNVVFVTDDVPPGDLVTAGHLDRGVRQAMALGMAPVDAVRAASLTPARRLRRHDLGAIAPGYLADILVLKDLETFSIHLTLADGKVVARDGAMVTTISPPQAPPTAALNSVRLSNLRAADFAVRGRGKIVKAKVLTERGRGMETRTLPLVDGNMRWQAREELALAAVFHRHGHNDNRAFVLLAHTGLQRGALATTYAHDSHNLVVVGRDPADMAMAANALIASGGGYVAVSGGNVQALAALPVAGLLAQKPVSDLAQEFEAFVTAAEALGVKENPIGLLTSLPLPVVPHFRPTDMGLVDVDRQQMIPAFQFE